MAAGQAAHLRLVTDDAPSVDTGKRICSQCAHGALSVYGVHCVLFREDISNEDIAVDCEEFEAQ